MEHNTARPLIATGSHKWQHTTATINPPSSRQVLERLNECLIPPASITLPSRSEIRRGAYDSMGAHCLAQAQKPPQSMLWAYKSCAQVIKEHSKSFYLSARLLPGGKREGIMALYAFCRLSDNIVDEADTVTKSTDTYNQAASALSQWANLNHHPESAEEHPVVVAWADTCRRYAIPAQLADELIEGVRMDLTIDRYETWNDLWVYCYRVASTVGLMSMYITGIESMEAVPYAVQLGIALQLTNILRDVGEDARSGRIYLPQEDMERFGYTEEMLMAGVRNRQFLQLMQFEIARANTLYDAAWPGIAMLPPDSRLAVATASMVYRSILAKIASAGYDVFTRRAHLTMTEKMRTLPTIWWRAKRLNMA